MNFAIMLLLMILYVFNIVVFISFYDFYMRFYIVFIHEAPPFRRPLQKHVWLSFWVAKVVYYESNTYAVPFKVNMLLDVSIQINISRRKPCFYLNQKL